MMITLKLLGSVKESLTKRYFFLLIFCWVTFFIWSSRLLTLLSPNFGDYTLRILTDLSYVGSILSMIGTFLATILAIFFSISIMVVQHAASSYTASILEGYKKDYRTWFVFFFYVASLALTLVALQCQDLYIVNMTIVTFIFSFFFLSSQFLHIIDLIDPKNIIKKIEGQCLRDLKGIPSRIKSIIQKKKPKNRFEEVLSESHFYSEFILHNERALLASSKEKASQISDVILKASSRREIETSVFGFKALSEIVRSYITIRQDHATQQDDFLQYIYDQLLSISEIAFDNKDISLLQEIIKAFEEIGCSTTNIKSISPFGGPNLSTSLAMEHICRLGSKAIQKDFLDVSAQAVSSIKTIGVLAIQKTYGDGLASDKILDIGILAIGKGDWFVLSHAFEGLKELLANAVFKRISIHKEPSTILENIEKLATLGIASNLAYNALQSSFFPILPEFSIQKVSWICFQIKNEKYPKIETNPREEYCKTVMSRLMQTLGKIAVLAAKKRSLLLLGRTVDYILKITISMLKEKFITIKEDFNNEVLDVVDDLESSYSSIASYAFDSDLHTPIPREISDVITSIAVYALEVGRFQVTDHCLEALQHMSVNLVQRDKYGYGIARCAGRISIIGAYALHRKEKNLSDKATELLANFDKIYLQKSPSPQDRLHIGEMSRLHKSFQTDPFQFETKLYGKLFKKVSSKVLDKFTKLYEKKRKKIVK
jgi:hypothetical protein